MAGRHAPSHAAPDRRASRAAERARESDAYEYEELPEREPPRRPAPVRRPSWVRLVLQDVGLTILVLCVFALFHHVIPILAAQDDEAPQTVKIIVTPTPTPTTAGAETTPEAQTSGTPEETETTQPDANEGKTPWQIAFADHFSDEVVVTENSYTSPNISITIEQRTVEEPAGSSQCYIADIYVASIECFQTYFATGRYGYYFSQDPESMAADAGAILSINGDYCNNQKSGFLVRNGELYFDEETDRDICVLFYDGTMKTFEPGTYTSQQLLDAVPYQSWKFGPALLDADGNALTEFNANTSQSILWENPRSAVGYYEPGHYCFVMVDGRQNSSRGLELDELAQLFQDLGCTAAYNLDGGASAVMTFRGDIFNSPSNGGRDSGDILLIREPEEVG